MRTARRRSAFAGRVAAIALCLVAPVVAALSDGSPRPALAASDGAPPSANLKVRPRSQRGALRRDALRIRVSVDDPARVTLRAILRKRGTRVRFAQRRQLQFSDAAAQTVSMPLTERGRRVLARRRSACKRALVQVRSRTRSPSGGQARRQERRRQLRRDRRFCGGGGGGRPGGGSSGEGGGGPGGGGGSSLRAGAASADITPPVGTPMFAYTARSGLANPPGALQIVADPDENLYAKTFVPSEGIHTRVRASAIVIERHKEKFALVSTDLGGLPYALVQEVLKRIEPTGVNGRRLLLSATHTHSSTGPIWPADSNGYALLGGDAFDPRVFELTAAGIAKAIRAADRDLAPARVGVGDTELRGASSNRNFDPFRRNVDVPADEAAARSASVNPELKVVRVDRPGGEPVALWSNFAIHQTSFGADNLLFSGDNAATTERVVERRVAQEAGLPAPAPAAPGEGDGPVLVWTNGAEGDISPNGGPDNPDGEALQYVPTSAAGANLAGLRVADGVMRAWRNAAGAMSGDLPIDSRRRFVTFDGTQADGEPVGPLTVLGAGGITGPDGFCAPVDDLAGPGQGRKFPMLAGAGLVPQTAPVSVLRLGGLGIASFPFEITTQMGRRITGALAERSRGKLPAMALAGLTNGYLSYTATPEEYDACHYEGSFTLFGRRQGPRLRDVALTLIGPLLNGEPAPAGALEPPPPGFGSEPPPPLQPTPDAGTNAAEPATEVHRYERAVFSWKGGDPGVDAPRGETFVRLQRLVGGEWRTVGTEDGPEDISVWDDNAGTWTEVWQFSGCDPLGTYRFRVTGRANRAGNQVEEYGASSRSFELRPMAPLEIIDADVTGTTARVRARYPDPGLSLLALPRRVRDGTAEITITAPGGAASVVAARPDAARLAFEATVPAGSTITDVTVTDSCGNTTG